MDKLLEEELKRRKLSKIANEIDEINKDISSNEDFIKRWEDPKDNFENEIKFSDDWKSYELKYQNALKQRDVLKNKKQELLDTIF